MGADQNERRAAAYLANLEQEKFSIIAFGLILLLSAVGIGLWMFWGYLNVGSWPTIITLRTVTHWNFTSGAAAGLPFCSACKSSKLKS